jgi:hypothetical protein
VTSWINFKRMSSGVNIVQRRWDQREEPRAAYEAQKGSDPDRWPTRHPGPAMKDLGWRAAAAAVARRHEDLDRQFRSGPDQ